MARDCEELEGLNSCYYGFFCWIVDVVPLRSHFLCQILVRIM